MGDPSRTCETRQANRELMNPVGMALQPSLRDFVFHWAGPGVETPGYCQWFLRNLAAGDASSIVERKAKPRRIGTSKTQG